MFSDTQIIILAAGLSLRLGRPKQSLPFRGGSLLEHTVNTALETGADVIVVLSEAGSSGIDIDSLAVRAQIVWNRRPEEGVSGSIRLGVQALRPDTAFVLIAVCDQPWITPETFKNLKQRQEETSCEIVASAYADTLGVPALFHRNLFEELTGLQGDEGAKKIILRQIQRVQSVAFPLGDVDVDTEETWKGLL